MEEDQVIAEWHMLVQAAKTPSAYLSSFHAFVLANALRRPILVYGDRFVRGRNGEPYAPSDVRGVYLPTLVDPDVCYKLPIAVGYTCVAVGKVGHFTALVGVDRELRHLPLVDEHGDDLPIRGEDKTS
ncbi:Zn-finger (Ran-binding)-3 [Ectocarpus siliculosus]|uniref:Zn-finger (Ran-binding)-3 n=1 Tax=Ectocarpus siliculosus TaxID=2880 RepID=D8LJP6_ECTSI|nr:Zn-finger (Ran-binding)-3 [Ectocarpus siliculosus]|eukprot:CBN77073.1 Zn-finger (Ran-binding)-3 [Ectocarpus siliculosus]